nr:hypothetical protein [uncultured Fluviicola sp.]
MIQTDFDIKILRQHWIKDDGNDDKYDLCSHGEIYIRIGDEILSNKETGSWALSATGLYLLRTLENDYQIDQFGSQFVPCCGHFLIPDENGLNHVVIIGCPTGLDWNIEHLADSVIFRSQKGAEGKLSLEEYKTLVLNLISEIELFYGDPTEKHLPEEQFELDGFNQFWAEWNELKNKCL